MAVFETWLKSDLQKAVQVKSIQGNLFSADNAGNLIGVVITDGGSPAEISGNVTAYVIRADGATVVVTGSLSGNRASVTLPASAYAVVGQASIVIKVGTTTVGACTIYVYRSTTDTIVDPGEVIPSITELLEQVEACRTATANANTAATGANTAATEATTKAGLAETAAGNANTAAGKINNMTVAATTLPAGSEATVSITEDQVDGHKHILFGVPKGVSGNETIDDTAGEGDTDKVWSADKSYAEITPLKNNVIVESTASGSIASFTDGADGMPLRSLSVAIEPVQDLHGQDAPYPAGGGKNLVGLNTSPGGTIEYSNATASDHTDDSVKLTSANNTYANMRLYYTLPAGTYTVKYQASVSDGNVGVSVFNGNNILGTTIFPNAEASFTLAEQTLINIRFFVTLGTATARTVTFSQFQLETGSSATAWTPYSNICPISGWDAAKVTRTGKNLFNFAGLANKGANVSEIENGYRFEATSVQYNEGSKLPVTLSGVHTISCKIKNVSGTNLRLGFMYSDNSKSDGTGSGTGSSVFDYSATSNGKDIIGIYLNYSSGGTFEVTDVKMDGESFGQVYPISFPSSAGTVYGGTLTIHQDGSGELVVDRAIKSSGFARERKESSGKLWLIGLLPGSVQYEITDSIDAVCNYGIVKNLAGARASTDICFASFSGSLWAAGYADDPDGLDAILPTLSIAYEIASHHTYALTAAQVTTILGQNNIWADTGNVTLEYPADTKLYIDGKIAEIQALILENISNS